MKKYFEGIPDSKTRIYFSERFPNINFKYLQNYKYYNEETNLWIIVGLINSIKLKVIEESI